MSSDTRHVKKYTSNQSALIGHVVKNFGLFGFGTPQSALLQCCKELVDNSVAACLASYQLAEERENGDTLSFQAEINVNLTQTHQCPPGTILVEVIDNGCGIADLDSIVKFFSSSSCTPSGASSTEMPNANSQQPPRGENDTMNKTFHHEKHSRRKQNRDSSDVSRGQTNVKVKGQYGVGLTTCLLYSQLHTHQPLRIATKTLEHTFCSCLDILFDTQGTSGQHRVQQKDLLEHSNFASGTRVSLYMPLSPGSHALSYVIGMLDVYFDRLSIMPSSTTTLSGVDRIQNPTLLINFRVSAFQQSYQGVYMNISSQQHNEMNREACASYEVDCNNSDHSLFLAQQFAAYHERSLPSSLPSSIKVYEGRVFLASSNTLSSNTHTTSHKCDENATSTSNIQSSQKKRHKRHQTRFPQRRKKRRGRAKKKNKHDDVRADSQDSSIANDINVVEESQKESNECSEGELSTHSETEVKEGSNDLSDVEVQVYSVIIFTAATMTSSATTEGGERAAKRDERVVLEGSQDMTDTISLELWRYANYSPLLDEDDDALSCACSRALRAVQWPKLFGYSLKLDIHQPQEKSKYKTKRLRSQNRDKMEQSSASLAIELEDMSEYEEDEEGDEWDNNCASSAPDLSPSGPTTLTRWILAPVFSEEIMGLREEERLSGREGAVEGTVQEDEEDGMMYEGCLEKIILVVNVIGASVPYSNMKKTAIEQKPHIVKAITADMISAMQNVQRRILQAPRGTRPGDLPACLAFARDLFVSKADRLNQLMSRRYLPALAAALAKMIQTSPCSEFHHECLERLGLTSEFMNESLCTAHLLQAITALVNGSDSR